MLRRRTIEKKHDSSDRIAKLEGRVDGLVLLLYSVVSALGSSAAVSLARALGSDSIVQQQDTTGDDGDGGDGDDGDDGDDVDTADKADDAGHANVHAANYFTATSSPSLGPSSDADADVYLHFFRSRMLRHFAFVHLPPGLTAEQLWRERPFLFQAMMAVVSPSARDKVARGRELKRVLAQAMMQENQSSMDLLLGLLTYIAWGWDNFLARSGLSRLMMMAMSLVGEMRLNKPGPLDLRMTRLLVTGVENDQGGQVDAVEAAATSPLWLERQRAVLGCFFRSSMQAITIHPSPILSRLGLLMSLLAM